MNGSFPWLEAHAEAVCAWARRVATLREIRCADLPIALTGIGNYGFVAALAREHACAQEIVVGALALEDVRCEGIGAAYLPDQMGTRPVVEEVAATVAAHLWRALPAYDPNAVAALRRDFDSADEKVKSAMLHYLERVCETRPDVSRDILSRLNIRLGNSVGHKKMQDTEEFVEGLQLRCGAAVREAACTWRGGNGRQAKGLDSATLRSWVAGARARAGEEKGPDAKMLASGPAIVAAIEGRNRPDEMILGDGWETDAFYALLSLSRAGEASARAAVRDLIACLDGMTSFRSAVKRGLLIKAFGAYDPEVVAAAVRALKVARYPIDAVAMLEYLTTVCREHPEAAQGMVELLVREPEALVPAGTTVWASMGPKAAKEFLGECRTGR